MAQKVQKTCYYELLGVDRKCEAAEIKANYRKLALKMHPDKAQLNGFSAEEATQRFQQIQEAYSCLSDVQERAWYDAHREQILKGDDEVGSDPFTTKINLYKYFTSSCFDGFGDGGRGFYAVYGELFEAIDTEEAEWEDCSDEDHTAMPPFGRSDQEWPDVAAFYRHWLDFCSRKAFGHADKWNPKEAPNRQVRRAMEQENKKARQAAKKDFNAEVRHVVEFVQKRDPRVATHQKQQMKANVEKKQKEVATKEENKKTEAKAREQRKEAARREEEERWAEVEAAKQARRDRGEVVSEDEASNSEEEEAVEYRCEPCRKSFKSEKAFDQHAKSKKHLQVVAKFQRDLERELREEAASAAAAGAKEESSEEEEEVDLEAGAAGPVKKEQGGAGKASAGGPAAKATAAAPKEEDSDEDEDSDEEDAFLARFAARRKAGGGAASSGGGGGDAEGISADASTAAASADPSESGSGDSDGEGDSPAADAGASGGKRAQRREKQRALLLQKKAEKESVQEAVSACKKMQRAAKQGAAEASGGYPEAQEGAPPSSVAPPVAACCEPAPLTERCEVCGDGFPSRSKLFQHIKASGHAALKQVPAPQDLNNGQGRGKKKR